MDERNDRWENECINFFASIQTGIFFYSYLYAKQTTIQYLGHDLKLYQYLATFEWEDKEIFG